MVPPCPPAGAGPLTFDFTSIDFPGAQQTEAFGVNDQGHVVGAYNAGPTDHGYLYAGGNFQTIDVPGVQHAKLLGINNHGQVVGVLQSGYVNGTYYNSPAWFFRDGGGAIVVVGPPNTTAAFSVGQIAGINGRGDIVAGAQGQGGFLLNGGQYTMLPVADANGINNPRQIVGANGGQGILLSGGQVQPIAYPGVAGPTFAMGLNNKSEIVGFYSTSPGALEHGFVLIGGKFTTVDFPQASQTLIFGINDGGKIVGTYTTSGVSHGFIGSLRP